MAGSWWPFWPFRKGASSSPANFVHLSRANIESMCERASHGEPLNPHQCRSISSALKMTMDSVERLVDLVDDVSSVCGSSALENFYRVSVKAKQLVENCCREDWCAEAAFQIQNEEAFREILLETSLSYNTIFEVVRGLSQNKEFLFEDLRDSSTFTPPSAHAIFEDLVALHDRLEGLVNESKVSIRSQHLGRYLLGRVKHVLEHPHEDEDFDVRSFNLWPDGKGPVGEWSEKSEFLGGNVCKTAWLGVSCAKKLFQDEMQEEEWLTEAKILASLNHPNIVKFLCCNKYETDHSRGHFIAMEQMDTSLSSFIKRLTDHGTKLLFFQALDIILQIAFGMCYLHENGIAHRDLKPSNVVVRKSSADQCYLQVKVADFGISKVKLQDKSNTITRPKIGTTLYMPPEAFSNGRANWFKADVYSFSVMCAVILSGNEPFQDIKRSCLFREISIGKRPMLPEDIPNELASVIKEGWAADRNSRPSFFDICTRLEKLRHSLLRDSTSGSQLKQEESGDFSSYIENVLRTRHESRPGILPIQECTECEEFDGDEEHQEEVDELLDRTMLEMQAATQAGDPSPRVLSRSTAFQYVKGPSKSEQNGSQSTAGKCKKRERSDQNLDPWERNAEASPLNRERSMKSEEIIILVDKDGGLVDVTWVDSLVQLMQQAQYDGSKKVADVTARRTKLVNVIAATEKEDCLNWFLHLGGLRLLDEWLQEAHKGKAGDAGSLREGDKGVEELLLGLLRALDRLPVDLKALKTYGRESQGAPKKQKGVRFRLDRCKWVAEFNPPGKKNSKISLGEYDTLGEAARAADAGMFCYGSKTAGYNFPDSFFFLRQAPRPVSVHKEAVRHWARDFARLTAAPSSSLPRIDNGTPSSRRINDGATCPSFKSFKPAVATSPPPNPSMSDLPPTFFL